MQKGISLMLLLLAVFLMAIAAEASSSVALTTPASNPTAQVDSLMKVVSLSSPGAESGMLQFKTGNHILGFQRNKAYLAGLDHALSVEFLGTPGVMPKTAAGGKEIGEKSKVPSLGKVDYKGLWDGISLTYEAREGGIAESTYHIEPWGDVSKIRLGYNVPVEVQRDGSLKFKFDRGYLTESSPEAWQEIGGKRVPVAVAFRVKAGEVGFTVGPYDPSYPLTIDPTYAWHTFYWSSSMDYGYGMIMTFFSGVATDGSGNVYITGWSDKTWNGPAGQSPLHAYTGNFDIFVLKLDSGGAYQWHTFYGSGMEEEGNAITTDGNGNVYVAGTSGATWNGPTGQSPLHAYGGNADIFVLKLDGSGAYQWHTFYGAGSNRNDYSYAIATDGSGNFYVTGWSDATWNGPAGQSPLHAFSWGSNIFVLKLDGSGAYQWHTFYGAGGEWGYDIATDGSGNVYVTGSTMGYWTGPAGQTPLHGDCVVDDIFVLKLDSSGTYQWHTFYGSGSCDGYGSYDYGYNITIDGGGNVYITGESEASWNGPTGQSPLHAYSGNQDIFVLKLNSSGAYQWHTFYGSSGADYGHGIRADAGGNVYITGESNATWSGQAGQNPLHAHNGNFDIFVLKLNSSGAYQWHTFFGSSSNDYGYAMGRDGSGNFYVTGMSGATWNGPSGQSPLHAHSGNGHYDLFVLKLKNIAKGDFNGDGKPDLIWRNTSTGRTTIWYMDGATWNGGFADLLPTVSDPNWVIVGTADFNNDGNPDILWRDTSTGRTTIWYMNGPTWNGGFADVLPTLNDPNWSILGIADFNRDGSQDLLWRNGSTGRTTIWYMAGPTWNGGYADVEPTLVDQNWSIIGIADFNKDGSPDLLWRDSASGRTTIWYMTGPTWNGGYADVEPMVSDPAWQIVAIRDFNNDGSPDLLWRNSSTFRTTVWYMDGPTWNGNWGDLLPVVSDPNWIIIGR
jgi:hypothetical protein